MPLTCSGVPVSLTCSCSKIHDRLAQICISVGGSVKQCIRSAKGPHEHRSTKGTVEHLGEVLGKGVRGGEGSMRGLSQNYTPAT